MDTQTSDPVPAFPLPRAGNPLDPPAAYDGFRDEGPKRVRMWDGRHAWLITRRDDVRQVLSSPHFSVDPTKPGYPFLTPARAATVKSYQTFITMDPPDHTRFRRMLTKDFTQKRMEDLRPSVQALVDGMIDDMIAKGPPADLIESLALRLPVTVISRLVGVPSEADDMLVQWSNERLDLSVDAAVSERAGQRMLEYFEELLKKREASPGDTTEMLGRLVAEQIRPGHLSRLDAVHMLNLLYFAGHETTANQIGLGMLNFLLNPDQREKLLARPELVKNAVEEMLRHDTPPHYNACRVAIADVTIANQLIHAGEGVYALLTAANRDAAAFPEPQRFDIERQNASEQMAFSYGLHQCIGQPLARLELQTVFSSIFKRLPRLALAASFEQLQFKREFYVYGLQALPVSW